MALEVTNKKINTSYKKVAGSDQQSVVAKLYAESNHSIAKILCMNVLVCSSEAESLNEEARYQTRVRFEIVYLSDDGKNYVLTDVLPVSGRVQNQALKAGMYPLVSSNVVDKQISSLQPDMIEVSAIIDTQIEVVASDEITFVENANNDIVVKKEDFNYYEMVSSKNAKFRVTDEIEVKEKIGKLLSASAQLCNEQVIPGTNYITIKGEVGLNLLYELEGDENKTKNYIKRIYFEEEIEMEGATPGTFVNFTSCVLSDEINAVGNLMDEATLLKVSIGMNYNIVGFDKKIASAVIDAFSLNNHVNLTASSFYKTDWIEGLVEKHKVNSTVAIELEKGEIDSIASHCGCNIFVASAYATEGLITVDGIMQLNVVYYMNDGSKDELAYESALIEIPYSAQIKNENVDENTLVKAQVAVSNLQAKRKSSKEFIVEAELCMFIQLNNNSQQMIVQNIEQAEGTMNDDSALKMYLAKKNSDLWEVCKKTCSTPEMIKLQNPDATFPLEEDTILIIYKQK